MFLQVLEEILRPWCQMYQSGILLTYLSIKSFFMTGAIVSFLRSEPWCNPLNNHIIAWPTIKIAVRFITCVSTKFPVNFGPGFLMEA